MGDSGNDQTATPHREWIRLNPMVDPTHTNIWFLSSIHLQATLPWTPDGTKLLDHMRYRFILLRQNVHTLSSVKLGTVTLNGGYITFIMHVTSNLKTNITPTIELLSSTLHQHTREDVTKLMPQNKPSSCFRIIIWNGPLKPTHFR